MKAVSPLEQACAQAVEGGITDSKTVVGLLRARFAIGTALAGR